jgi:hypothetical protein
VCKECRQEWTQGLLKKNVALRQQLADEPEQGATAASIFAIDPITAEECRVLGIDEKDSPTTMQCASLNSS